MTRRLPGSLPYGRGSERNCSEKNFSNTLLIHFVECGRVGSQTTILYVITDLHVGGVPLHLHRLACAMCDRGYRPIVASLAKPGRVGAMLEEEGIEILSCDACCGWDFRVIGRLTRIIEKVRPDIVHALLFHANIAARLAAERAGFDSRRLLCEIQTVEVQRRWHLWVDQLTHAGCWYTIANSPSVLEHLATSANIPRGKLRLVRGGIDPEPYQLAEPVDRAALRLPQDVPLMLWVGRLDPVKGLDVLLKATQLLGDPFLLLVGEGAERTRLGQLADRLGVAHRVRWLGTRHDIPALLKTADVFVLSSRTEGLPNALLEAMAAACPIVTTDVPGCRDLIEHQKTGLIVPYGSPEALAGAIRRMLEDRTTAEQLGRQAHEEVSNIWHINRTFDAYEQCYVEIGASIE